MATGKISQEAILKRVIKYLNMLEPLEPRKSYPFKQLPQWCEKHEDKIQLSKSGISYCPECLIEQIIQMDYILRKAEEEFGL